MPALPIAELLVAELAKSGRREIAIKSERFPGSQRSHEGEAGGIYKGIFASVMATKSTKGRRLDILRDVAKSKSRRPVDGIEKINRRSVPCAPTD
jgi:hypothetical protein